MAKKTTPAYDQANNLNVKEPVIILKIEGLPYVLASAQVYTKIRYDDPGILYDGTYVYDGLRPVDSSLAKNYIDRKGSNTVISQKLEQWDGKASIETMSIKLVDKNQLITSLLAPGFTLNEILNKRVKVFFGYQNISYPEDYIRIFSGLINEYVASQGSVMLNFTDPSSLRKQEVFNPVTTTLTGDIDNAVTTIPVVSTGFLYETILNGKGINDSTVTIGIVIDNEIITYNNAGINVNGIQLDSVTRGAFGTVADVHSSGTSVSCFIFFQDNPINIALKTMLSGWEGPCFTDIGLRGIVNTDDGNVVPDSITFEQSVDLQRDYGLAEGDFIILSGSSHGANNATFTVESFINDNRSVVVVEKGVLIQENPSGSGDLTTVAAIRSQFDTYPTAAGLQLTTDDVDVDQHTYLRDTFIQFEFSMPVPGSETSGKDWIETHIFKPIAAYSLTQGSRISIGLTHPPLQSDLTKIIDHNNVVQPSGISVNRGLNSRFFYDEIVFQYAWDPIQNIFAQELVFEQADAQSRMKQVSSLAIDVRGLPDDPTSLEILRERAERLLLRYQFGAETVALQTKFATGNTIDSGDIVVLTDKLTSGVQTPVLQIMNSETGKRGIYDRVMEVQERAIRLSDGRTQLTLLSNNGFSRTDRYAVIAPSSTILSGTSGFRFQIQESFGGRYPGQEYKKWQNYQSQVIAVHSPDFTRYGTAVFTLDTSNLFIFNLATDLGFTPLAGDVVEFSPYDETSSPVQSAVKNIYVFIDKTGNIFSGTSSSVFTLTSGEGANFLSGNIVYIQSPDGSRTSPDLKIISIVGDIITVGPIIQGGLNQNIGFTPSNGDYMKLGGFNDGGQSYRYV